jgi:hypothetical protein
MIQIDGPKRHVYIKFSDTSRMQEVLTWKKRHAEYRHTNGEMSKVRNKAVGLGMRKIRIACLPPEVHGTTLRMVLGKFGEVRDIQGESGLIPNVTLWPTALE